MLKIIQIKTTRCLFCLLILLISFFLTNAYGEEIRLSCDFSLREPPKYIREFIGHSPWIIDIDLDVPSFEHISHAKRDKDSSLRHEWYDKTGKYSNVEINGDFLTAEKEQWDLRSKIKFDLSTGHLNEKFSIKGGKGGARGDPMAWNFEFCNADCSVIEKQTFKIR